MTIDGPTPDTNDFVIEITPAMVDAGVDALCGFHFDDPYNKVVIAVYRAMAAAGGIGSPDDSSKAFGRRRVSCHQSSQSETLITYSSVYCPND